MQFRTRKRLENMCIWSTSADGYHKARLDNRIKNGPQEWKHSKTESIAFVGEFPNEPGTWIGYGPFVVFRINGAFTAVGNRSEATSQTCILTSSSSQKKANGVSTIGDVTKS